MKLSDIKPFVRFSRYNGDNGEYHSFKYPLCAGDCRLFYCVDGEGHIVIDGEEYSVSRGTLLLWRAGVPYTYYSDKESPMRMLGVNFDYTWEYSHVTIPIPPQFWSKFAEKDKNNARGIICVEAPVFEDAECLNKTVVIQNAKDYFYKKLLQINDEYEKKQNYFELKCSGILCQILVAIAENSIGLSGKDKLAEEIIEYLSKNYGSDISVNELGEKFGYHPNYLNQLFIKYTGNSIYAYLQELRIIQAINLLENSDMSVAEVGVACGFSDRSHFSRYFKQKTGRTPKAFRP